MYRCALPAQEQTAREPAEAHASCPNGFTADELGYKTRGQGGAEAPARSSRKDRNMPFCPTCGTPNTDQAEKCVACAYELIVPKHRAKFKGTIMMSGIKAPSSSAEAAEAPAPPRAAAPVPQQAPAEAAPATSAPQRNL